MNDVWFIVWIACFTSLAVVIGGALVLIADWMNYRRMRAVQDLDRSRKAFMDMEPITVQIGQPLYDQDLEGTS